MFQERTIIRDRANIIFKKIAKDFNKLNIPQIISIFGGKVKTFPKKVKSGGCIYR